MSKSALCTVKTQLQAEGVITRLRAAGIDIADISLVLLDRGGMLGLVRDRDSHIKGKPQGAPPAGPMGGVLGMLTDIGAVAIPGEAAHIMGGPVATSDGDGTPPSRGVAQRLVALGCSEASAQHYEGRVRWGDILLAVRSLDSAPLAHAVAVFVAARADDISASDENLAACAAR